MLPQLQRLGACTALWPSAFQPCSSTHPACSLFACQAEVEQYYIKAGYLFPAFHEFYWFGYRTTSNRWVFNRAVALFLHKIEGLLALALFALYP